MYAAKALLEALLQSGRLLGFGYNLQQLLIGEEVESRESQTFSVNVILGSSARHIWILEIPVYIQHNWHLVLLFGQSLLSSDTTPLKYLQLALHGS